MSQTERALDEDADELDDDVVDVELVDDEVVDDGAVDDELVDGGVVDDEVSEVSAPADDNETSDSAVDEFDGVELFDAEDEDEDLEVETIDDEDDDLLEGLRRADIDGPTVAPVPDDDASLGVRRLQRASDYDHGPVPVPTQVPRLLGHRPRVRRVTRVVRHVDPWSVFKIAIVGNLVLYVILLTAGVLLWNVAHATGTVDNVERFFESFGWSEFEFNGGEIFHSAWIGGLFLVLGFTGLAVLFATLFNLITDLVGGMRFTVLEEEVVEARPSPLRQFIERRLDPDRALIGDLGSSRRMDTDVAGDADDTPH